MGLAEWLTVIGIVVTALTALVGFLWAEIKENKNKLHALDVVVKVLRNDANHLQQADDRLFTTLKESSNHFEKEIDRLRESSR